MTTWRKGGTDSNDDSLRFEKKSVKTRKVECPRGLAVIVK